MTLTYINLIKLLPGDIIDISFSTSRYLRVSLYMANGFV